MRTARLLVKIAGFVLCALVFAPAYAAEWAWFQACKHASSEPSGMMINNGIEVTGAFRHRLTHIVSVDRLIEDKCTMIYTSSGDRIVVVGSIADVCERVEGKPGCEKQ